MDYSIFSIKFSLFSLKFRFKIQISNQKKLNSWDGRKMYNKRPDYPGQPAYAGNQMIPGKVAKRRQRTELTEE